MRVTGNRVHDRAGTGIALRTPVQTWIVKENVVQDVGVGIAIEGRGAAERVAVDNNEVLDVATNAGANTAFGIVLTRATSAAARRQHRRARRPGFDRRGRARGPARVRDRATCA